MAHAAARNVALLSVCQALTQTVVTAIVAVAALAGAVLAADKTQATLPHALYWTATMAVGLPASLLMRRIGRRGGFWLGCALGLAGALLAAFALVRGSFALFIAGSALLGGFNGIGMFYRFAAAEVSDVAFRPKAIALVIGGGVIAAFAGPELAKQSKDLMLPYVFAGCYLAIAGVIVLLALILLFVSVPRPRRVAGRAGRPLMQIVAQPRYATAVLCGMIAWGGMVLVMTATPLTMVACGHDFADAAFVVQWHIFAMFAPSFVSGGLIRRFGIAPVLATGLALFVGSVGAGLSGLQVSAFWAANFLIGFGWNLLYVGATAMLTETYRPEERAKAEGVNDLLVFAATASAVFVSGWMQNALGWDAVNYAILPMAAVAALALVWLGRAPRRAAA